jgi:uncharacterized protein (DUF433 family)
MRPRKRDRITINPAIMNGQPCIRGMRLTVRRVLEALALSSERAAAKLEYPELEDDDSTQALEFAARCLDDRIHPLEEANVGEPLVSSCLPTRPMQVRQSDSHS